MDLTLVHSLRPPPVEPNLILSRNLAELGSTVHNRHSISLLNRRENGISTPTMMNQNGKAMDRPHIDYTKIGCVILLTVFVLVLWTIIPQTLRTCIVLLLVLVAVWCVLQGSTASVGVRATPPPTRWWLRGPS
ncbi:hypothetical protein CALCODRAFT_30684 [Calocera cornea HHB12733]|uniref:Uncharacterized protein n=1 Tax=Calocera cornea HHB12733 TaxID=1353952 RepID=A0A165E2N3_9BASI|nr:hypothetical protein CALCODRAFT_30684 [Calocera cornea HHB12733]